jgi:preprotein translocase subunit SecG
MITSLLIIHAFVTIAMIGLILLQKGEGSGPLGMGGGMNSLFTARGVTNLLTRSTAILGTLFIGNCVLIGVLTNRDIAQSKSFFNAGIKPQSSGKKNDFTSDKPKKSDVKKAPVEKTEPQAVEEKNLEQQAPAEQSPPAHEAASQPQIATESPSEGTPASPVPNETPGAQVPSAPPSAEEFVSKSVPDSPAPPPGGIPQKNFMERPEENPMVSPASESAPFMGNENFATNDGLLEEQRSEDRLPGQARKNTRERAVETPE